MKKQEILDHLNIQTFYSSELPCVKWNGTGMGQSLCPFHNDTKPSLSVNLNTGQFKCFGCEQRGSIFDFYMLKHNVDFYQAKQALATEAGLPSRKIVTTYDYKDESGKLLYQTVRYEPKDFKQRRPDGKEGWIYNLKDIQLVPYNLNSIKEARSIIIVEGEKDADALNALGLFATCNPMGAGKWNPEFNEHFKGKKVAILPDNDKPGKKHAQTIAKNLSGIAKSVKVVELSGIPEKGDVSNWLNKDGTKESLIDLIRQTPEWESQERRYLITVHDILTQDTEPIQWIVPEILPEGGLTLLTAPPSHYKTWFALDIGKSVSTGNDFLGWSTNTKEVYYIDKENPKTVLKQYLQKLGVSDYNPMRIWPLWGEKEPPSFPDDIYSDLTRNKPLLIFDSLIRFYPKGTDENSSSDMSQIMGFLRNLTKQGATVLVLHHKGKGENTDYRGSSDILGGVDVAFSIKKSENASTFTLKCLKSRFQVERDIPIEVIADDTILRFENASEKIAREKQQEETERIEVLKEIIGDLGKPNQTELIKEAHARLGVSEHQIRPLLQRGEGIYWQSEGRGRGKPIHYSCLGTSEPPNHIYSTSEVSRLEEPLNRCSDCILTPAQREICEVQKPCPKKASEKDVRSGCASPW